MHEAEDHHPLCTIEFIAGDETTRCPLDACAFWERGCVLARIQPELEGRPDLARFLVDLRRTLEAAG